MERWSNFCQEIKDWIEDYVEEHNNLEQPAKEHFRGRTRGIERRYAEKDSLEPEEPRIRSVESNAPTGHSRRLHQRQDRATPRAGTPTIPAPKHGCRQENCVPGGPKSLDRWCFLLNASWEGGREFPEPRVDNDTLLLFATMSHFYQIYGHRWFKHRRVAKRFAAWLICHAVVWAASKHEWFDVGNVRCAMFEG